MQIQFICLRVTECLQICGLISSNCVNVVCWRPSMCLLGRHCSFGLTLWYWNCPCHFRLQFETADDQDFIAIQNAIEEVISELQKLPGVSCLEEVRMQCCNFGGRLWMVRCEQKAARSCWSCAYAALYSIEESLPQGVLLWNWWCVKPPPLLLFFLIQIILKLNLKLLMWNVSVIIIKYCFSQLSWEKNVFSFQQCFRNWGNCSVFPDIKINIYYLLSCVDTRHLVQLLCIYQRKLSSVYKTWNGMSRVICYKDFSSMWF